MGIEHMRPSAIFLAGLLTIVGLGGCGQDPSDQLREHALEIYAPQKEAAANPSVDPDYVVMLHEMTADALDQALDRHPEADEGLRNVLSSIRDGEREIAAGAGAEELRQQIETYWSHLERGELPPDYR